MAVVFSVLGGLPSHNPIYCFYVLERYKLVMRERETVLLLEDFSMLISYLKGFIDYFLYLTEKEFDGNF